MKPVAMGSAASTSEALGRLSLEPTPRTQMTTLPKELLHRIFEPLSGSDMHALQAAYPGQLDAYMEGFCRRKRTTLRLPEDVPLARDAATFFAHYGRSEEEAEMADWLARFFGHVKRVSIRGNWSAWFFPIIEKLYTNDLDNMKPYKRWMLRVKTPWRKAKLAQNLATVGGWKLLVSVQGDFPLVDELELACPQGSFYPQTVSETKSPAMDIVREAELWRLRRVVYRPTPDNVARYVDLRPLVEAIEDIDVQVLPDPETGFVHMLFPYRNLLHPV